MNILYLFLISVTILACKPKQLLLVDNKSDSYSVCPEDGSCSFEVSANKSLTIAFDGTGAVYPKIANGNSILAKFTYKRKDIPNTADGHYREEIYMELNPEKLELNLIDNQLTDVKLFFARWCFCRGQTGYYRIKKGHLQIKKVAKKEYVLTLNFKADEVPQVIHTIKETIVFK